MKHRQCVRYIDWRVPSLTQLTFRLQTYLPNTLIIFRSLSPRHLYSHIHPLRRASGDYPKFSARLVWKQLYYLISFFENAVIQTNRWWPLFDVCSNRNQQWGLQVLSEIWHSYHAAFIQPLTSLTENGSKFQIKNKKKHAWMSLRVNDDNSVCICEHILNPGALGPLGRVSADRAASYIQCMCVTRSFSQLVGNGCGWTGPCLRSQTAALTPPQSPPQEHEQVNSHQHVHPIYGLLIWKSRSMTNPVC